MNGRANTVNLCWALSLGLVACIPAARAQDAVTAGRNLAASAKSIVGEYPGESNFDTAIYPDEALAALGDRALVPALVEPLKRLRFDYRVHIARALGILGGDEARKTLRMLVAEDPNISVRGEAERALKQLDMENK